MLTANRVQDMTDWVLLSALAAIIALVGCDMGRKPAESPAAKFIDQYAQSLAADFENAARAVKEGQIKTDAELLAYLKAASEASRKDAAQHLDRFLESQLSNGELSELDAAVLRNVALQFRGASYGR